MARGELDQVLRQGHEAGILAAGQRSLAQQLFEVGNQAAISFGVPANRLAVVDAPVDVEQRGTGCGHNHPIVLVSRGGRIVGFVWYADLCVRHPRVELMPTIRGRVSDRHPQILLRLYDAGSEVAVLLDDGGDVRSVVTRRQLVQPLIK